MIVNEFHTVGDRRVGSVIKGAAPVKGRRSLVVLRTFRAKEPIDGAAYAG
jgi:hypothetical protein